MSSAWLTEQDLEITDPGRSLRASLLLVVLILLTALTLAAEAWVMPLLRGSGEARWFGVAMTIGIAVLIGRALATADRPGTRLGWLASAGWLALMPLALFGACYTTWLLAWTGTP